MVSCKDKTAGCVIITEIDAAELCAASQTDSSSVPQTRLEELELDFI